MPPISHNPGVSVYDQITIRKWRDELAAQDGDPEAMGPTATVYDAEAIDLAAEAEYWRTHPQAPHRPLTWGDVRAFVGMLAILGLCGAALVAWLEYGSTFLR